MLQNLDALGFRPFGTILPTRSQTPPPAEMPGAHLALTPGDVPLLRAAAPCRLENREGMTALCVSTDGKSFTQFYLDKPVVLNAGVQFYLTPLLQTAAVTLWSDPQPENLGLHSAGQALPIQPRMQVEGLYTLFYQEKEAGFFFPGESHSLVELTYVEKGSLHSVVDGADTVLAQGDMTLYGPHQWHMQYADIGVAPRFITVSFALSGQLPEGLFGRKLRASQACLGLLERMFREKEKPDSCSEDMILHLLGQLLITLVRQSDAAPQRLQPPHHVRSENNIIRRAQQYVGEHVRTRLSVPEVALKVGVSPSYLTALFRKYLQISPGEYIRRVKLQESRQMIRENAMTFTEIADALDYSSVNHFSRQFKEKFGMTPSEYARSVR